MKKQITILEILSIFIAPAISTIVMFMVEDYFYNLIQGMDGMEYMALFYLLVVAVPSFVIVFISSLFQSWRYKVINGTISIFVLVGTLSFDVIRMSTSFWGFVWAMVRVAVALSMGLIALNIWRNFKRKRMEKKKTIEIKNEPFKEVPRLSAFLRLLSTVSVPFVFITVIAASLITLGLSALALLILLQLPRIPIVFLVAAAIAPFAGLWASVTAIRAIVSPKPLLQSAILISLDENEKLKEIITDVANKMNCKMPDNIILHTEPVFFVTQAKMSLLDSQIQGRTLALGMPLLKEMTVSELKAVLAHEFAHYTGNDTVYSQFVSPVYRGIGASIQSIRSSSNSGNSFGAALASLMLPAVYFLINFLDYFAAIDNMLSRNRELRADWLASSSFGKDNLISSLEKATINSALFPKVLNSLKLQNDTTLFSEYLSNLKDSTNDIQEVKSRMYVYTETEFDTHPSLKTRMECLPEITSSEADSSSPADSLTDEEVRLSQMIVSKFNFPLLEEEEEKELETVE